MPKKKKLIPAVSYLRRSNSAEGSDSERRQSEATRSIAKKLGYEITEEFFDAHVSGTKAADERPELSRLMLHIESNGIKTVFVEAAHRLARSVICGGVLIQKFGELGVKVIDSTGVDLTNEDDPQSKFIRDVLLCLSELEKQMVVQRMAKGRAAKAKTGVKVTGRKFYGETDPIEKENLKEMRRLRKKPKFGTQLSFASVAKEMNNQSRFNRSGNPWTDQTVRKVLLPRKKPKKSVGN